MSGGFGIVGIWPDLLHRFSHRHSPLASGCRPVRFAKTDALAFRVKDGIKPALTEVAAARDRSVSWLVEQILTDWLTRHGHLPARKASPRKRPARLAVTHDASVVRS
jgi:predicted transcriptional regulator